MLKPNQFISGESHKKLKMNKEYTELLSLLFVLIGNL